MENSQSVPSLGKGRKSKKKKNKEKQKEKLLNPVFFPLFSCPWEEWVSCCHGNRGQGPGPYVEWLGPGGALLTHRLLNHPLVLRQREVPRTAPLSHLLTGFPDGPASEGLSGDWQGHGVGGLLGCAVSCQGGLVSGAPAFAILGLPTPTSFARKGKKMANTREEKLGGK